MVIKGHKGSATTLRALFTYEGVTNNLRLADSGAGGVAELAEKFHISKPQYGLCKVGGMDGGALQIALISLVSVISCHKTCTSTNESMTHT
ncbi:hypothetical protein AMECASPLE_021598 [Ameca splendens]|uniref:Uncharacterized protein n=1 Tax=Ameca splendens TaxID=208324 RepID=A0ABV0YQG9_9TELE